MKEAGELPIAIDDARVRLQSLVDLILFTDQQAMTLLSVYVTLGTAAAGIALTALSSEPLIPVSAGWGMAAAAIMLFAGAILCLRAAAPVATFPLAGEGADFWLWAVRERIDLQATTLKYLERLEASTTISRELNRLGASELKVAKRLGLATPLVALASGVAAQLVIACLT
jgi:hypothetical protein